jgi:DHA2 family multidrug resistance protein
MQEVISTNTKKIPKTAIALTAALGLFPVVLDTTIVNVGLIPISKALNTDLNQVQWIAVGYMLANAAMVSLSGYLGNRYGVKRLFMVGIILFGFFSFLCGVAPDLGWLIAFRVFQGIGGGMLLPLGVAIALAPFTKEERIKAGVIVGVPLMLAPVFAPIIGGWIIDNLNWQYIFFINVPISLLSLFLTWRYVPKDEIDLAARKEKFDYLGLVLSTLGILAIVYGFKLVGTHNPDTRSALNPAGDLYGWGYWQVWTLLGAGVALLVAFGVYALRFSRDPVLDLRLFKYREFTTGNLVSWVSATAMFGALALIPSFFQQIRLPNLSAVDTGLATMPLGVGTLVGMIICRKLYSKVGPRGLSVASALLMMIGFWQLSQLSPTTSGGDIWFWLGLLGVGVTLGGVAVTTLATENLSGAALNKGTSLFQSTKSIFGAVGPTVLVTLLVQQTTWHAEQIRNEIMSKLPAGTVLNPNSPQIAQMRQQLAAQAGTSGVNDIFNILVYVSVALLLISLTLPGRRPQTTTQAEEAETTEPSLALH